MIVTLVLNHNDSLPMLLRQPIVLGVLPTGIFAVPEETVEIRLDGGGRSRLARQRRTHGRVRSRNCDRQLGHVRQTAAQGRE